MRFNLPSRPKDGDTRARKTFAWRPVKINNQIVWLENYWCLQVYRVYASPNISQWNTVRRATMGLDVEALGWRVE